MRFSSRPHFLDPARWVGVVLFLAVFCPAPVHAGQPAAVHTPSANKRSLALPASCPILLADESSWSWSKLLKPLELVRGSRRNMIQLATVGMCIALYIIWWRKFCEK